MVAKKKNIYLLFSSFIINRDSLHRDNNGFKFRVSSDMVFLKRSSYRGRDGECNVL